MEIKTKYPRGGHIYFMFESQVKYLRIEEIKVRITESTEQISYGFRINGKMEFRSEHVVYSTKEDLLNSL